MVVVAAVAEYDRWTPSLSSAMSLILARRARMALSTKMADVDDDKLFKLGNGNDDLLAVRVMPSLLMLSFLLLLLLLLM